MSYGVVLRSIRRLLGCTLRMWGWLDLTICITSVLQLTDDFSVLTQQDAGESSLLNLSTRSLCMGDYVRQCSRHI